MYAEGERLLRDFPVQATLEFATESDSDSDSDPDDDAVHFDHIQSNDHENSMELQARAGRQTLV